MPTDYRVVLASSKLSTSSSTFARGNDTMMVASRPVRLQAPIPHLTDAILRRQLFVFFYFYNIYIIYKYTVVHMTYINLVNLRDIYYGARGVA